MLRANFFLTRIAYANCFFEINNINIFVLIKRIVFILNNLNKSLTSYYKLKKQKPWLKKQKKLPRKSRPKKVTKKQQRKNLLKGSKKKAPLSGAFF